MVDFGPQLTSTLGVADNLAFENGDQFIEGSGSFALCAESARGLARAGRNHMIGEQSHGPPEADSNFLGDKMTIHILRLGSPRESNEGLRIGTVRRPPRGVRKEDYASKNIYDIWFPNLSPSEPLLKEAQSLTDENSWKAFKRKFTAEMNLPGPRRDLDLFAALSHRTNFAIGCYCKDESRCHRSILRDLLEQRGADIK